MVISMNSRIFIFSTLFQITLNLDAGWAVTPESCIVAMEKFGKSLENKDNSNLLKSLTTKNPYLILENQLGIATALIVRADILGNPRKNLGIVDAYRGKMKDLHGSVELPAPTLNFLINFIKIGKEYEPHFGEFNNVISERDLIWSDTKNYPLRKTITKLNETFIPQVVVGSDGKPSYVLLPLSKDIVLKGDDMEGQVALKKGKEFKYYEVSSNNFVSEVPSVFLENFGPYRLDKDVPAVEITFGVARSPMFIGFSPSWLKEKMQNDPAAVFKLYSELAEIPVIKIPPTVLNFLNKYHQPSFNPTVLEHLEIQGAPGSKLLKELVEKQAPRVVRHFKDSPNQDRLVLLPVPQQPAVAKVEKVAVAPAPKPVIAEANVSSTHPLPLIPLRDGKSGFFSARLDEFDNFLKNYGNSRSKLNDLTPAIRVDMNLDTTSQRMVVYSYSALKNYLSANKGSSDLFRELHNTISETKGPLSNSTLVAFINKISQDSAMALKLLAWSNRNATITEDPSQFTGDTGRRTFERLLKENQLGILNLAKDTFIFIPVGATQISTGNSGGSLPSVSAIKQRQQLGQSSTIEDARAPSSAERYWKENFEQPPKSNLAGGQ
ncbi:MAG: hypothetical protein JWQ35_650 [Bacteriovoracaceae bacterium]|nr:hypothetical protein [Bacteriovoracaceae bacterium]